MVNFECDDCGEKLRGEPGAVARCPYCQQWLDAPYPAEDRAALTVAQRAAQCHSPIHERDGELCPDCPDAAR